MEQAKIHLFYTESDGLPKLSYERSDAGQQANALTLQYLNEGGANVVFRIIKDSPSPMPDRLRGRLLRLRKDLDHVRSAKEQLNAFECNFRPMFHPSDVISHELIELDDDLPLLLNQSLLHTDRPGNRNHDFLPVNERHGLLVMDMTPRDDDETLLQLKPKWLAQSPSAPPNARRCRTCALRAQRASKQVRTATDGQASCPLALVSPRREDRRQAAAIVTSDVRLREYLVDDAQALLKNLQQRQIELDPEGVLEVSKNVESVAALCKAMTLRDCTLFLRRSGGAIEARLGDLDLKSPGKVGKWRVVEVGLRGGGWYENAEANEVWTRERICLLADADPG